MDDFFAGGSMGALGVASGQLRLPFVSPTRQEDLFRQFKWLRTPHLAFVIYGTLAATISTFTRPYEDYLPAMNYVNGGMNM